nr:MAG TPA: PemK-like protein [Caudoviricetes sp.]
MEKTSNIERGTVWYAQLHNDENNSYCDQGKLPVVIVSNDRNNTFSESVCVCVLSEKEDRFRFLHPYVITESHTLLYCQCDKPRYIDKKYLVEYLGRVREQEQICIDRALAVAFGLEYTPKLTDKDRKVLKISKHVYGILEAFQDDNVQVDTSVHDPIHHKSIHLIKETPSQPDLVATHKDETTCTVVSESESGKQVSKVPKTSSALDRFNSRYSKYLELSSPSHTESVGLKKSVDPTPLPSSSKLGRVNARKWTDQLISRFLKDYTDMPTAELLRKYDLSSEQTANKYFRKFSKGQSL